MLYKKGLFVTGCLILMIIAGLSYTLLHHEEPTPILSYGNEHYTVFTDQNQKITIDSNNLISHVHKEELLTKTLTLPKHTPISIAFRASATQFIISIEAKNDASFAQTTTIPTTKAYNQYIPYEEIESGIVGLFVGTDNKSDLELLQHDPHAIQQLADKQAILLEQAILIE
ncbi:hypothetical protein [Enterococcus bulliens]